ncbi:MAG: hypothetical protein M3381_12330 [Actinomycetota bacterium]|nr:hypothetical protein [Actinomycetota bacterium]
MPTPPVPGTLRTSPGGSRIRSGGALTAWANSWLRGAVSYDAAVSAIHEANIGAVRGLPDHPEPAPVGWVLSELRSAGGTPLRLVLPVPGDIRGVPDSPGLAAAATHAGQLVVGFGTAFLPDPDRDPSADRVWLAWELADAMPANATPGEQQTISQAEGALRHAVLDATDVLAALDVARWNPGVESLLCREPLLALPHDHEPSAVALATRATRLGAILELAWTDAPGGALNAHGAVSRDAALRPLSVAVREALMTAYSATPVRRTIAR